MRLPAGLALLAISPLLTGCLQSPRAAAPEFDAIWCLPDGCKPKPGPYVAAVSMPEISADGGRIVLPFWCRPPNAAAEEARAVQLDVASGAWSKVPYDSEALRRIENAPSQPVIPNEPSSRKSCAADCSRYAYKRRVDPKDRGYFYEIFTVENGRERQLTNFHVQGDPLGRPVLSADGRRIAATFAGKLAVIEVPSGAVRLIAYRPAVWNVCMKGHV